MTNSTDFATGQRWISSTEPELGLGIILEASGRSVSIVFPAAQERRTYASDNAPLSRVRYREGDKVTDSEDRRYEVLDVNEVDGYATYAVMDNDGMPKALPELELNSFVQFSTPRERLLSGQLDKPKRYHLRLETIQHRSEQAQATGRGLLGARVQLLPHQLYIANTVGQRHAPRVLLADEVGLGKTIEAGLILHQQLITGRAQRALIVVPESLLHQWLVEMLRRFNLSFTILDEQRCAAIAENHGAEEDELDAEVNAVNPFESAQLILCSMDFLQSDEKAFQQALDCDWDLLIVDEAHHLEWQQDQPADPDNLTPYQRIEALAQRAIGLLLLTATPEQLGVSSHFARLRLLDPDRYHSLEQFLEDESHYKPLSELIECLTQEDGINSLLGSKDRQQQLAEYIGADALATALPKLEGDNAEAAFAELIRELLDRHGTGRVLFRNTRHSVSGFPGRQLLPAALPAPTLYQQIAKVGVEADDIATLIQPEAVLGPNWLKDDPRVQWLVDWLRKHRGEKVLVICAQADTARDLEIHLRVNEGQRSSVFHEHMSLLERDRAAAYFSDPEQGAQVLICSEIGSEGRNFQFSQHLILFDLPLNPDLLEQRIGRLDRIGQKGTVHIHVPHYADSPMQQLLEWYDQGLDAFSRPFPAGQALLNEVGERLQESLIDAKSAGFDTLINETKAFTEATLEQLQQGRDRLVELNSCDHPKANAFVSKIADEEDGHSLSGYMERVFDAFGVDYEPHSEQAIIVRPGEHMVGHSFPGLPEDGLTATFFRETALSREDMHFLSWEHPMVTGAIEMVAGDEFGNCTLGTIKLQGLEPGTLLLEAIFTLSATAPKFLQLGRYLPAEPLRVLIDSKNRKLDHLLSTAQLNQYSKTVPRSTASDLARHARPQLEQLLNNAEKLAAKQQDALIAESLEKMQALQDIEINRLEALSKVNPNIKDSEVQLLRDDRDALEANLQSAQLRMEAVRVVLAT